MISFTILYGLAIVGLGGLGAGLAIGLHLGRKRYKFPETHPILREHW